MRPSLEIASLAMFLKPLGYRQYFGDIKEGCVLPSVFFPLPECDYVESTVSSYKNMYSIFVKVVDKDSVSAYEKAEKIVQKIQVARKLIPFYDSNGIETGYQYKIGKLQMKVIDAGVAQIYITYDRYEAYYEEEAEKTGNVDLNLALKKQDAD